MLAGCRNGPGKGLEKRLYNVMWFIPVQQLQMQVAPGFVRKPLEKLTRQSEPEHARHVLLFLTPSNSFLPKLIQTTPNQVRPSAEINHAPGKAFVHRHVRFTRKRIFGIKPGSITPNPFLVPQGLHKRLTECQTTILDRVMSVY